MPHFHEFRELLDVDEARLRELVAGDGDPPERLWAVWALAMRRDPDVGGVARDAAGRDPSPGVRAHMALLLVSLGERDAAMTLARHDPEAFVRASAYRHLSRTAKPDDLVLYDLIASAMQTDPGDDVPAAIADAVRSDAPEIMWRAVIHRLGDANDAVRTNVVDALVRRWRAGSPFPSELRARVTEERAAPIRATILRAWVSAEGVSSVLRSLGVAGTVHALDFLIAEGESLSDGDVAQLLTRDVAAIDARVAAMHQQGRLRLPLRWLCELVVRYATMREPTWTEPETRLRYDATRVALEGLGSVLGATLHVTPEELVAVTRLRDIIEEQARSACSEMGIALETLQRLARGEDLGRDTELRLQEAGHSPLGSNPTWVRDPCLLSTP